MSFDDYVSIALNHVRLVLEFVRSIQADERIDAILAIIGNGLQVRVRPGWHVNIRSGPGISYKVIGTGNPGDTFPLLERVSGWGRIGDGLWVTLNNRYMEVIAG